MVDCLCLFGLHIRMCCTRVQDSAEALHEGAGKRGRHEYGGGGASGGLGAPPPPLPPPPAQERTKPNRIQVRP